MKIKKCKTGYRVTSLNLHRTVKVTSVVKGGGPPPVSPTFFRSILYTRKLQMATLNDFKEETMKVCQQKGWDSVSTELLWMLFVEEIGELASAIRRTSNNFTDRKRANVTSEWYDCLSYLFQIADRFQIDLNSSWDEYVRYLKRRRQAI